MTPEQQKATPEVPQAPAPADADTSAPKPTPFDAAAKVVRVVQLTTIHFSACSAQALETADAIPDDVDLVPSMKFSTPTVVVVDDCFSTSTTLLFQVGGKLPEAEGALKPYAVVRATIEAKYKLKPDAPKFSDDDLKDYALCYCPFHVWGYWREFVQSSLARLDLPQITVPLFLIAQAPQMVQDQLE